MNKSRFVRTGALLLALGIAGPALAADTTNEQLAAELAQLKSTVSSQQAEISKLRNEKGESWLNERRAEEVKQLVREVLSDADTRASLQGGGLQAGYKSGFFIASEDGANNLRINFTEQVRYTYNTRREAPGGADTDEDKNGFSLRRTQLNFQGNVFGPQWTYRVRLAADGDGGTVRTDWAYIGYQITDNLDVKFGQLKPGFLREEIIGADKQLAVERSYVNDYFTTDYSQGAQLTYWNDRLQLIGTIHDGSYGWRTEFNNDRSQLAVAARAEYIVWGDAEVYRQKGWRQLSDFTSWSDDKKAVLLGAAVDYEWGEEGAGTNFPDILKYTVDVQGEFAGWNLFGAFVGQQFNGRGAGIPGNLDGANQFGVVAQAGVFVIPDKLEFFGRYEWLNFDSVYYRNDQAGTGGGTGNIVGDDDLNIATVGGNWYFKKNNAKLTLDVQYIFDALPANNVGGGTLITRADGDEIVVRSQFTLSF